jgi:hypothetical protein
MRKSILIVASIFISCNLYAASVGIDNQKHQTIDKSVQESQDQSFTDENSKTATKEKGTDINYGTESSKSKDIENSLSKETSLSNSKSKSLERTVDIQATMMMQEVDFLVKKFIDHNIEDVKVFIGELNPTLGDLPIDWQQYFNWKPNNFSEVTQMLDRAFEEEELAKRRYPELKSKPWTTERSMTFSVCSTPTGLASSNAFRLPPCVINIYQNKYSNLLIDFFNKYGLSIKSRITIGTNGDNLPQEAALISKAMLLDIPYSINFGGDAKGELYFSLTQGMKSNFTLFSDGFFTQYKPSENSFMMAYKNMPIIAFDNNEILHFYGDLVFNAETRKQSIVVIDKKINADGLNLSLQNQHNKFDDYFKKLMKLYLEAFASIGISQNNQNNYSFEEIEYRVREYLYQKTTGKDDFLEQYLTNPKDFWRPNKDDLQKLPIVNTGFNDVIYSKQDGMILNQKISFQIKSSDSVNESFNRAMREARNERFTESVRKAVNQFERENKSDLARLTKQLATKITESENASAKMDRVSKSSISTDVLKNLLNIAK